MPRPLALAILGPTASGKSDFAMKLAEQMPAEIVCLDSLTPYKGFDIGSSKPSPADQEKVPHHLIDILEPDQEFSAFSFVESAWKAIGQILDKNKTPLIVGGTYFYFRALEKGLWENSEASPEVLEALEKLSDKELHEKLVSLDSQAAQKIHPNDRYRLLRRVSIFLSGKSTPKVLKNPHSIDLQWVKYGLLLSRRILHHKIQERTRQFLEQGLLNEAKDLLEKHPDSRAFSTVGYAECKACIKGELPETKLFSTICEKTNQLAKRQMTWLRSDPDIRFANILDVERVRVEVQTLQQIFNGK